MRIIRYHNIKRITALTLNTTGELGTALVLSSRFINMCIHSLVCALYKNRISAVRMLHIIEYRHDFIKLSEFTLF